MLPHSVIFVLRVNGNDSIGLSVFSKAFKILTFASMDSNTASMFYPEVLIPANEMTKDSNKHVKKRIDVSE